MARPTTYRDAGVSIAAGDELVRRIAPLAAATRRREVVADVGGFAAMFRIPKGYREPLLVAATDGVGTKLRLAFDLRRHDTVGIDLVAMNVNDVLTLGAEPLVFLDYLATSKLRPSVGEAVVRGIAEGCRQAGCALVGGETAEMPSFYAPGEYDLAGFVVAVVEARRRIDGRTIAPGDIVIGLSSSGVHSNGFSLVRKLVADSGLSWRKRPSGLDRSLGEILLTPTRIYSRLVVDLVRRCRIKGMAHITGGGITGNLPRVLPRGCEAVIRKGTWPIPPIFRVLQGLGQVQEAEMYRTFNMGIGYVLVVADEDRRRVLDRLRKQGETGYVIGEIRRGSGGVRYV